MDIKTINEKGETLDDVLNLIKDSIKKNTGNIKNKNSSINSILSDPNKYILNKNKFNKNNKQTLNSLKEKYNTDSNTDRNTERNTELNIDIKEFNLEDECLKNGDDIHDTYILPCKLKLELKKTINFVCNQNIEQYKNTNYLKQEVKKHIINVLPKFNFSKEEIKTLFYSGINKILEKKTLRYIELLIIFKNDKLLSNIINKYINDLITNYRYTEFEAINSAFKFLNTLVLGSETFEKIEQYYSYK